MLAVSKGKSGLEAQEEHEDKIKLGISRCLLGEKVRYDGSHQLVIFSPIPLADTSSGFLSVLR